MPAARRDRQAEKAPSEEAYIQRINAFRPLIPSLIAARRW
ncbi:hypothetical protein SAMN05216597_1602 [Pseudomonas cannabina]|nr:hypothetical protein SAMN05216597_1602 [Pseudomonas cannabina]